MYGNSLGNAAAVPVGMTAALPVTGFDTLTGIIIGAVLVCVGAFLVRVRKPARERNAQK